jgi:uncharacterized protein YheU (UPF0270 family)
MNTDAEIAAFLAAETGGSENAVFVCDETVCVWVPEHSYVQGFALMTDELNNLLVDYLVRRGRVFGTIDDAIEFYKGK